MAKDRINLAVTPKMRDKIEDLQGRLDGGSLTEVVRRAIELLDVVLESQTNGDQLIIRTKDGEVTQIKLVL